MSSTVYCPFLVWWAGGVAPLVHWAVSEISRISESSQESSSHKAVPVGHSKICCTPFYKAVIVGHPAFRCTPPFHEAAFVGHPEICFTPFHEAAIAGHLAICHTPSHKAAIIGHP